MEPIFLLDIVCRIWYNGKMKNLSYHGKNIDQAQWVVEYFGTPEKREFYKDNKSYQEWVEDSRTVIESERLSY